LGLFHSLSAAQHLAGLKLIVAKNYVVSFYRIVGDDDGGQLFSPEEYEGYKKRVVPKVSHGSTDSAMVTTKG